MVEAKFGDNILAAMQAKYIDFEKLFGKIECWDTLGNPPKTETTRC